MLLYISQPLSSLPKLMLSLTENGKLSSYRVNILKSKLMPVCTSNSEASLNSLPFKIKSPKKFKYLGIWITDKDLYTANYQPLLSNLNQDIEQWGSLPLSLGGRINTVKMNILPKFLYIFQCLSFFLTKSFFTKLNDQISSFIWNNKTPRIKRSVFRDLAQWEGWHSLISCITIGRLTLEYCYIGWVMIMITPTLNG